MWWRKKWDDCCKDSVWWGPKWDDCCEGSAWQENTTYVCNRTVRDSACFESKQLLSLVVSVYVDVSFPVYASILERLLSKGIFPQSISVVQRSTEQNPASKYPDAIMHVKNTVCEPDSSRGGDPVSYTGIADVVVLCPMLLQAPVQTADILETMLDFAQINVTQSQWVRFGQTLRPALMGGDGDPARYVYSEGVCVCTYVCSCESMRVYGCLCVFVCVWVKACS